MNSDMDAARQPWWSRRRDELLAIAVASAPCYVYDPDTVRQAARSLLGMGAVDRVLYAMKANPHPGILGVLADEGVAFECVSSGELAHLQDTLPTWPPDRVLFTPNFAPRAEYVQAVERGVHVTLDGPYPLDAWPDLFEGRPVFLRIDPGKGSGHHAHVNTAGVASKFGLPAGEAESFSRLANSLGVRVEGLHMHIGSGILEPETWAENGRILLAVAAHFPDVAVFDLGGGLGVPSGPDHPGLDLDRLAASLEVLRNEAGGAELWLEPGRFLVADAGVLLARVTQVKQKGEQTFVGIETGMNSLLRPALYGATHGIHSLGRLSEPPVRHVQVVGPICESADVVARDVPLPEVLEGDVLLVETVGAYGHAMSSRYNMREPAVEVLLPMMEVPMPGA